MAWWFPDVGGFALYLTFVSTCSDPSFFGFASLQPASRAASSSSSFFSGGTEPSGNFDGAFVPPPLPGPSSSLPPPPDASRMIPTITTAVVSTPAATSPNSRRRSAASAASRSRRRRSSRRRCFSSLRLVTQPNVLSGRGAIPPRARLSCRRSRLGGPPALVEEARQLAEQAIRGEAELDHRCGLHEPAIRQLPNDRVCVVERVDGVARMPEHDRRRFDSPPLARRGRDAPEEEPLEDGPRRTRVLADPVEAHVGPVPQPVRHAAERGRDQPGDRLAQGPVTEQRRE